MICACCAAEAAENATYCENCGEASWLGAATAPAPESKPAKKTRAPKSAAPPEKTTAPEDGADSKGN